MARAKTPKVEDPNKLKRERAGRYVTPDGRFAVEGQNTGNWYLVDNERENELGLPLMEGPFATLDRAHNQVIAIREGRATEPAARIAETRAAPPDEEPQPRRIGTATPREPEAAEVREEPGEPRDDAQPARRPKSPAATAPDRADEPPDWPEAMESRSRPPKLRSLPGGAAARAPDHNPAPDVEDDPAQRQPDERRPSASAPPREPTWLDRLSGPQQAEARRLLAILERLGIDDPALVRRDMEANLPEVARALLARRVRHDALAIWHEPAAVEQETERIVSGVRRHLRPLVEPASAAAERVQAGKGSADDVAAFAWLVAVRTVAAVFEVLDSEGHERRVTGEPGWRLVELDGRREPTNRAITLDVSDILEPAED